MSADHANKDKFRTNGEEALAYFANSRKILELDDVVYDVLTVRRMHFGVIIQPV